MYSVIGHGNGIYSICNYAERQGRAAERGGMKEPPIRTRVLVQMVNRRPVVLRGSLLLSTAEVHEALNKEIGRGK